MMKSLSNKPLVSVIMPTYNCGAYITLAVASVQAQTYTHWQLIIVDDCSTDDTANLVKQLCDPRLVLIQNDKNSGPAKSRNAGIAAASGKYLTFIDADDTYEPEFLSKMVGAAEEFDADIVWCNYYEIEPCGNKKVISSTLPKNQILDSKQSLLTFFTNQNGLGSMWNKIYRHELITNHGIRLNEQRTRAEDWQFNLDCFGVLNNMVAIDDCLYNYFRRNAGSVMSSYREKDLPLMVESFLRLECLKSQLKVNCTDEYYINSFGLPLAEYLVKVCIHDSCPLSKLKAVRRSADYKLLRSHFNARRLPKAYALLIMLFDMHLLKLTKWLVTKLL
ncbi:MAG: glycosyltransferase family 2 protein [Muribaculaceae bacterium]